MSVWYAIKHLSSGLYLPCGLGRGGRGFTWVEPEDGRTEPPRLFSKRASAMRALSWWLKGTTKVSLKRSANMWGEDEIEDWNTTRVPSRRAEDMEVVCLQLQEVGA